MLGGVFFRPRNAQSLFDFVHDDGRSHADRTGQRVEPDDIGRAGEINVSDFPLAENAAADQPFEYLLGGAVRVAAVRVEENDTLAASDRFNDIQKVEFGFPAAGAADHKRMLEA